MKVYLAFFEIISKHNDSLLSVSPLIIESLTKIRLREELQSDWSINSLETPGTTSLPVSSLHAGKQPGRTVGNMVNLDIYHVHDKQPFVARGWLDEPEATIGGKHDEAIMVSCLDSRVCAGSSRVRVTIYQTPHMHGKSLNKSLTTELYRPL